ncbi:hypothetical protein GCM10023084_58640 [Streptomyces lacrimifluminis]|uniref:Uncharacterized protein n=1 Tax=Streptomyces lacrimifluminis TaxID=1500077 RepID=A0A917LAD8_9ACTN|nr:hypothetical protein GCM10012282_60960 [Streptomyces lacrimifluminis]
MPIGLVGEGPQVPGRGRPAPAGDLWPAQPVVCADERRLGSELPTPQVAVGAEAGAGAIIGQLGSPRETPTAGQQRMFRSLVVVRKGRSALIVAVKPHGSGV